jgi:hypothetical protein
MAKDLEVAVAEPEAGPPFTAVAGWSGVVVGGATLIGAGIAAAVGLDAALAADRGKGDIDAFEAQGLIDRANTAFAVGAGLAIAGALVGGAGFALATAGNTED